MITDNDIQIIDKLKEFLLEQVHINETDVDWDKVVWHDTLSKLVGNLKIAELSYTEASKSDKESGYYTAQCNECGWFGTSRLLLGGGQIGDTGDYDDVYCPVCENTDIDER